MKDLTRRRMLLLAGSGSAVSLAGCMDIGSDDEGEEEEGPEQGAEGPGVGERETGGSGDDDDDDDTADRGETDDDEDEYDDPIFNPMNDVRFVYQGTTVIVEHHGGDTVPNGGSITVEWGSYSDRQKEEGIPTPFAEGDSFQVDLSPAEQSAGTHLTVGWEHNGDIVPFGVDNIPDNLGE